MKNDICSSFIWTQTVVAVACLVFAESVSQAQSANGDYAVTQAGPHSRVWVNAAGQTVTEIATGMNVWNGQQWTPSDPSFVVSPDGTAFVASKIQDPTQLAANLNVASAVTVTTPDNVTLRSTPIAIGLYDAASGKSVIVATLTNTTGVLADPQHVVYNKAFVGGGFAASVVYSLPDTGSFHQDVVFTGFAQPFDPTIWGFAANSAATLQIQIFTEFYDPPQPQMVASTVYAETDPQVRASMASPDLIDYTLDFGDYVFWPGRAYTTAAGTQPGSGARILKDFVTTSGRTFLVESIPLPWIENMLQALPATAIKTSSRARPSAKKTRVAAMSVPALRKMSHASMQKITPAKSSALAAALPKGVTADYVAAVSTSYTPVVYAADTTYYVSGNVYDYAPVTLESAVFKFPTGSGILYIQNNGALTLGTTNYRPAIFTAADDNTAGATLSTSIWSGYTGNTGTNRYGVTGLWLWAATNVALNNLEFRYQFNGVAGGEGIANEVITLSHCQFVDCINGIIFEPPEPLTLNLNNCLFSDVQYQAQWHSFPITANAWNCTFDGATYLLYADGSWSGTATFNLTNSILSNITNEFVIDSSSSFASNAAYNGFYNAPVFGTSTVSNTANPYQSVAAGNYYLSSASSLLTAGTTNIGAGLSAQLALKTVLPPVILTNVFSNNTALSPVVQRDTSGTALGFHYDPIDYISACSVSNATLLLTNGVALAYYDNLGINLLNGSQLVSQGAPNYRNYLVYYGLVQEQPLNYWGVANALAQSLPIAPSQGASANPSIFMRLTTISAPQGETNLFNTADTGNVISGLTLRDCEVYGAGANWLMVESTNNILIGLTNNVFHRVPFAISNNATIMSYNNLFYGTTNANEFTVSIRRRSGSSANAHENDVFDGVSAALDGTTGYNAYLHGATNTVSTNSTDLWNNLTWQAGPYGAYYQTNNSPLLTNGSTFATNLGLYHYTVGTNEVVEGTNIVSRGYHYVAVGANGLPLVSNTNGIPDYLADANGDGIIDDSETGWYDVPCIFYGPFSQGAMLGANPTFSVDAGGTPPLAYQWFFGGASISGATGSTLTVTNFQTTNVGSYTVVITNQYGSITSAPATLNIAGQQKWSISASSHAIYSAPALGPDGTVYVAGQGTLYALYGSTGALKWSTNLWLDQQSDLYAPSPAVSSNGTIYIGGEITTYPTTGIFYSVNPNGSVNWSNHVPSEVAGTAAIASDGTIYVGTLSSGLYAFNTNGTTNWFRSGTGAESTYDAPAIGPDCEVQFESRGDDFLGTVSAAGDLLRLSPLSSGLYYNIPLSLGADGSAYVEEATSFVCALNPNGTLRWQFDSGSDVMGSAVAGANDTVYSAANFDGSYGRLYALTNGGVQWTWNSTNGVIPLSTCPAVASNQTVYVVDQEGILYAIANGTVRWAANTTGGSNVTSSAPVIGPDGTIYFGDDGGHLHAIYGDSPPSSTDSWPMFGQNAAHTGAVPATNCTSGGCVTPVFYELYLNRATAGEPPSEFSFSILGPPSTIWTVQASSDGLNWSNLGTVSLDGSGGGSFEDNNTATFPQRIYYLQNGSCSSATIGYAGVQIARGATLVGDPFFQCDGDYGGPANTLEDLSYEEYEQSGIASPPLGTVVQQWGGSAFNNYTNTTSGSDMGWQPTGDATMLPGQGLMVISPTGTNAYTLWFTGLVPQSGLTLAIHAGTNYLSAMIPVAGPVTSVLNYVPAYGDQIWLWDTNAQAYLCYTNLGAIWQPGEPFVQVGQGFVLVTTNAETLTQSWSTWAQSENPFAIYDQGTTINGWTPQNVRLSYWRFNNTNNLTNEAGIGPTTSNNLIGLPDWSGKAVSISNNLAELVYPAESNGLSLFNTGNGSVRFWYQPSFDSSNVLMSGSYAAFLNAVTINNWNWSFALFEGVNTNVGQTNQTSIILNTSSNTYHRDGTFVQFPGLRFNFQSNYWYQIVMTYSPSNEALYFNGTLLATGNSPQLDGSETLFELGCGNLFYPPASDTTGISVGNNPTGGAPLLGQLDELETFNYPLTAQQVAAGYPAFGGNSTNMVDTYYLGQSDMLQQYVYGYAQASPTNVVPARLGYWRFDSPVLYAEQGQMPLAVNDVELAPSWSGTAMVIKSDPASQITYPDVGSNGWANINCRQGSLRFWVKQNGSPSTYPAPFVYMGSPNGTNKWALELANSSTISFVTRTNQGSDVTILTAPASCLSSSKWAQITLTYGPASCALYTNGVLAGSGVVGGNTNWPNLANRQLGMVIGNSTAYNVSINGQFEEMETFNYQLSATDVASNFQMVASVDSDLNGIPDLLEDIQLPTNRPFLGRPVVITGTIEAEQFDMGGSGVGYNHPGAANPPSSYRPTGMFITNCDDLGGGYCLDRTVSNDWAAYTINVLVPQTYVVDTRVEGLGTNGSFKITFSNSTGIYTNTGPFVITNTSWTNLSVVLPLKAGTNIMTLTMLTNANTNGVFGPTVGRFNYISIYPYWTPPMITNNSVSANLLTNSDYLTASNNAFLIQSNVNYLSGIGGGIIYITNGTYYLAQPSPNETSDAWQNAAVSIMGNNIEIAGNQPGNTTLIAYNRATTMFCLGERNGSLGPIPAQCTNFVLCDITIEGSPHLAISNGVGTTNVYDANPLVTGFSDDQVPGQTFGQSTGTLAIFYGPSASSYSYNILITNCQFLYGNYNTITLENTYVSNLMVRGCTFNCWDSVHTNFGDVGLFLTYVQNLVLISNSFNGNTSLAPTNFNAVSTSLYYGSWLAPAGLIYCQGGGNIFVTRNIISNYLFEGVQLSAGPSSVVGNNFGNMINTGGTCALDLQAGGNGALLLACSFIGNSVYGGRTGQEDSYPAGPYTFNTSGNTFELYPPYDNGPNQLIGEAIDFANCQSASVCGNTVLAGGYGIHYDGWNNSMLALHNDFGSVRYRGIGATSSSDSLNEAQIYKNALGQGASFHAQLGITNGFGWFLEQNTYVYTNANSIAPFFDPAAAPIHLTQ